MPITLDHLRCFAVSRSLFTPTTLPKAIARLGFLQADPIRAPARAQDLTLRHRVKNYVAGDLERRYPRLDVEEDFFVNYGFLPRANYALMHPRAERTTWDAATRIRAQALLGFVQERGEAHPRDVDAHFLHGSTRNYWGGSSNATTHLLDAMHYRGMLRVVRRENGIRIYAAQSHAPRPDDIPARTAQIDALVDLVVRKYAPLTAASLGQLVSALRAAAPQCTEDRKPALARARERLAVHRIDGTTWYWPADEDPRSRRHAPWDAVRLLAPFDPVVWDRSRFELFWGWAYRFEAYTPAPKRKLGYYALPLLWREQVVGWGNLSVEAGRLIAKFGYVAGRQPRDALFRRELDAELDRMRRFLALVG